jgi:hypothetical protein
MINFGLMDKARQAEAIWKRYLLELACIGGDTRHSDGFASLGLATSQTNSRLSRFLPSQIDAIIPIAFSDYRMSSRSS